MKQQRSREDSDELRRFKYRSPVFAYVRAGQCEFSGTVGPHRKPIGPHMNGVARTRDIPARICCYSSDRTIWSEIS